MTDITAEQLKSVLSVVSKQDNIKFDQEQHLLESKYLGYQFDREEKIDQKTSLIQREGERAAMAPPSAEDVQAAKTSADDKTKLDGAYGFLIALLKTNRYLAAVLFVLVVVATLATVVPSFPRIGAIVLWLVVVGVAGIILAAARDFLKGKVLSKVNAYCLAIAYEKGRGKECLAAIPPPAKVHRTCWEVWLTCGHGTDEFLVGFDGNVAPVANP